MQRIVGIDEAGRGCWAGPLVAAAVLLPEQEIDGLRDSKLLSKRRRSELDVIIRDRAAAFGLGWVSPGYIDRYGLTAAVRAAMQRALNQIDPDYDEIIIDGSFNFLKGTDKVKTLVKADQTVPAVSAASIIAKVARDAYMTRAGRRYPSYNFSHNVGYGTAGHVAALQEDGICALHRLSYQPIRAITGGTKR